MKGSIAVRFSELSADTIATHGAEWARSYYRKQGMPAWEFDFWLRSYLEKSKAWGHWAFLVPMRLV